MLDSSQWRALLVGHTTTGVRKIFFTPLELLFAGEGEIALEASNKGFDH
jgi:hypothetical protein